VTVGASCSGGSNHHATAPTSTIALSSTSTTVPRVAQARCPQILPDRPANSGVPGLADKLVPLVATRLDVCRYGPLTADEPLALKSHFTLVDRATITAFETAVNALGPVPPDYKSCPVDNGEALVVLFSSGAHSVSVRISQTGCALITNGVRTSPPSTQWNASVASIEVAGCPATPPAFASQAIQNDPHGRVLAPITATSVRVCRYSPVDASLSSTLTAFGVLDDSGSVRVLEAQANGLVHNPFAQRVRCPILQGEPGWAVTFSGGTSSVDLIDSPGYCGEVYNGVLTAGPTTAWLRALARIAVLH
jgi:hypothetical protein